MVVLCWQTESETSLVQVFRVCLNKCGSRFQIPAYCKKVISSSAFLDRSRNRPDRSKIADMVFCRRFILVQSLQKRLGFHLNFSKYIKKTLTTFWRLLEDLCITLWDSRGFLPSNHTRFYQNLNYN